MRVLRTALAVLAAVAAATGAAGARAGDPPDPAYAFARSLAEAGPRPAGSAAERRAHARVRAAFAAAGLRPAEDVFAVPGRGRSRNVIGIADTPADCLVVVVAHADSMPRTAGAEDNASGVGVLAALAARLRATPPACDTWLAASGAEERLFTGRPDHLGASALVRRVRRLGRAGDLRLALSVDEVGRGDRMLVRSGAARPRAAVEGRIERAAQGTGLRVGWRRDSGTGHSDHREFQLAGLPAAKLGVPDNPCRHAPCDVPARLSPSTLRRTTDLVARLLASG